MKNNCMTLYAVFFLQVFFQFLAATCLLANIALLVALVLAYTYRAQSADTIYHSHFTWLIRTFWIGTGVYLPVIFAFIVPMVYPYLNIDAVGQMVESGIINEEQLINAMLGNNRPVIYTIVSGFTLPFAAWWLYRCWVGFAELKKEQPLNNVMRWY